MIVCAAAPVPWFYFRAGSLWVYVFGCRRSEVINSEMAAVAHKLTNGERARATQHNTSRACTGQRRKAILQCVVALNDFMKHFNATYKDAYWSA